MVECNTTAASRGSALFAGDTSYLPWRDKLVRTYALRYYADAGGTDQRPRPVPVARSQEGRALPLGSERADAAETTTRTANGLLGKVKHFSLDRLSAHWPYGHRVVAQYGGQFATSQYK